MQEHDQRSKFRAPLTLAVSYKQESDFLHAWTANLSSRGLFIVTDDPPAMGAEIVTRIHFPGIDSPAELNGTVVWRQVPGGPGPSGVGVRIDPEGKQRLLSLAYQALATARNGFRILVHDPDPRARKQFLEPFKHPQAPKNFVMFTASEAEEAIDLLRGYNCDLLVTNIDASSKAGSAKRMLKLAKTQGVPVIGLVQGPWSLAAPLAYAVGVRELLQKPFQLADCLESVALHLVAALDRTAQRKIGS